MEATLPVHLDGGGVAGGVKGEIVLHVLHRKLDEGNASLRSSMTLDTAVQLWEALKEAGDLQVVHGPPGIRV